MNDNEKKYSNKKEFVFSNSEKPDLDKYKDKKSFEFEQSPQFISTSNDFIGSKKPEFTINSQPNFKKYETLNEFHFQEKKFDNKSVPENVLKSYIFNETPKPSNEQNLNIEKKDDFKKTEVQNNTLNSESNIDWEDIFNSMNNQSLKKKPKELIKVGHRKSEQFKEEGEDKNIKMPTIFMSNDKSKKKDNEGDRISTLKQKVQNLYWDKKINWNVIVRGLNIQPTNIELHPCDDCHPDLNPLYMHKVWLERLYYELDLSDQEIAEICGMTRSPIAHWRKRLNIDTKEEKGYIIDNHGYKILLMPPDYIHPQLKSTKSGRQKIAEQRIVMETFLRQNPHLEASKRYLIGGKYLKSGPEVHHVNQDRLDNRIENLWLYPTKEAHLSALENLNQCLSVLIKLKQISFHNGEYGFDSSFDYRNRYNEREIQEINKPMEFKVPFENIDEIKAEIKNWRWHEISQNWTVKKYVGGDKNSIKSFIEYELNPYNDCDENSNPLYMHKHWMEKVVNDIRFNLTDPRLSVLCGITIPKTYYWRWEVHKIPTKGRMGAPKILIDGYIWIKIPDDYKNPFAKEYRSQKILKESRYIAERFLANSNSPLKNEYLLDGKYLKRFYIIHHINLDKLDNQIENLYITNSHQKIHSSLRSLVKQLLNSGFLDFNNGKYFLI